jgi:cytochrome c oxidase assembly protein subunit 11
VNAISERSNAKTARILAIIGLFMLALAFAAVPLYRMFCEETGFGGTTQRAAGGGGGGGEGGEGEG